MYAWGERRLVRLSAAAAEGRAVGSSWGPVMTRSTQLRMAVSLCIVVALPLGAREVARSRTFQTFGRLVARVETKRPIVALTFDDGPTAGVADEILRILESRQVRATFFVIGSHLAQEPDLGRRLVAAGHELGNHTYSHNRMVLRSQRFVRAEVERTDGLIRAAGQTGEIYFRAPFCWKLLGLPWYLWRTGRTSLTWDVAPDGPSSEADAARIVSACRKAVRPGSIILLHVWYRGREASRAAVPALIDQLRADGYEFVTVRELLSSTQD
jgi:peptidoglycan/xylan/chitin deacetylase (PgdA/CDA1 family)